MITGFIVFTAPKPTVFEGPTEYDEYARICPPLVVVKDSSTTVVFGLSLSSLAVEVGSGLSWFAVVAAFVMWMELLEPPEPPPDQRPLVGTERALQLLTLDFDEVFVLECVVVDVSWSSVEVVFFSS